jgi:hypothetical protein
MARKDHCSGKIGGIPLFLKLAFLVSRRLLFRVSDLMNREIIRNTGLVCLDFSISAWKLPLRNTVQGTGKVLLRG